MRRAVALVTLILLVAGVWLLRPRPDDGTSPGAPRETPAAGPDERRHVAPPPRETPDTAAPVRALPEFLGDLVAALASGDVERTQEAAVALRRLLRTDPDSWQAATELLADAAADQELRGALAVVLGTIDADGVDAVLRDALAAADGDLARALVLALGATREPPDDDDVFHLGDRPWGEHGPGGLGITVRRTVEDEATRRTLEGALRASDAELRRVAAVALRHSLASADARDAFFTVLREDPDDGPVSEVAEALAQRARRAPEEERSAFLLALLARAAEPGLDALRFRVMDDLHRVPLTPDIAARVRELALADEAFAIRGFALELLGQTAQSGDDGTVAVAREVLVRVLELDADPALRDVAARVLRDVPAAAESQAALLRALREDRAWNVRYTALETLVRLGGDDADAALRTGNEDGDERVRALAAELGSKR